MAVFNSWGKSFSTVVAANSADLAAPNEGVAQAKPSCDGGSVTPPPSSGPMSITTSGPAGTTLVETSVANDLADFNFSGSGTITSLTLERTGVSTNSTLSNVYLYDGATRLTDASTFGSDNKLTFSSSSLFTVSGSKTISVRADVASSTSGQNVGVKLTAYNGNAVSVQGATFGIAVVSGLATASFASPTPGTSNSDPGSDVTVWNSAMTVSNNPVWFSRLALRKTGSISNSDVNNFKLYVDGTYAASASIDANGYLTFAPSSPMKLLTGSRTFRVAADIIGGSSRSLGLSLRSKADVGLVDSSLNAGIAISSSVPATSGDITVNGGSFSVVKAGNSTSGNVVKDAADVVVGRWTLTAMGEAIKVDSLNFGVDTSLTDTNVRFRNARVMWNGSQVGATTSLQAEDFGGVVETGTSFTTNQTVTPGSPVTLELRMDMFDNLAGNDIVNAATFTTALISGDFNNGTFQNSLTVTDIPATAVNNNVAANQLTIVTGTMSMTKQSNYTNQNTTVPQTNYKLAAYNLVGSSTEDITVNNIEVTFATSTGTTFSAADLTNVYLKYGSSQTSTKSSVVAGPSVNSFSVSFTLAKNSVVPIEVWGNIGPASSITVNDAMRTDMTVYGNTTGSSTSVNTGLIAGQVITYKAGSVSTALNASSPTAAILNSNQSLDVAKWDVTATNDSITITEATVKFDAGNNGTFGQGSADIPTSLTQVTLGGVTKPASDTVVFTGLNITVPANSVQTLTANVTVGNIGTGAGLTGEKITAQLATFKYLDSQGAESNPTPATPGNATYAYKAVPQIDTPSPVTGTLANGAPVTLYRFNVTGQGGTIGFEKVIFTVNKVSAVTIANPVLWDVTANQAVTLATNSLNGLGAGSTSGTASLTVAEQQVSGTRTYEFRADVGSVTTAGDFITTKIAGNSAYFVSDTAANALSTQGVGNFVWSDRSALPHSDTSTDWTRDNGIKTLPTNGQTLQK